MMNRKQLYTNQTSSRWNKVNKMRQFTVLAYSTIAQKKIYHGVLSFFCLFYSSILYVFFAMFFSIILRLIISHSNHVTCST